MKITKQYLRKIINEELNQLVKEAEGNVVSVGSREFPEDVPLDFEPSKSDDPRLDDFRTARPLIRGMITSNKKAIISLSRQISTINERLFSTDKEVEKILSWLEGQTRKN